MKEEKTFTIELHTFKSGKNETFPVEVKALDIFTAFQEARKTINEDMIILGASINIKDRVAY